MFYLFLYVIVLLAGLYLCRVRLVFERENDFRRKKRVQGWNAFLVFAFVLFVLVASFRSSEVGADTYSYAVLFNKFADGESFESVKSIASTIEIGYLVFIKIISMFTDNTVIFFMVHSIIIYGCFLKYLKENSEDVIMSVMFFTALCFTSTFNIMRQYLAIGLVLSALTMFRKKKRFQASGLCAASLLIHRASIVMIPIIFIDKIKNKSFWFLNQYSFC
ncbi:MAG: EpsG family protein [Lachnospiraceae bacterium]|nr:EpsG family protein [Lachnospiraceae bacterium]